MASPNWLWFLVQIASPPVHLIFGVARQEYIDSDQRGCNEIHAQEIETINSGRKPPAWTSVSAQGGDFAPPAILCQATATAIMLGRGRIDPRYLVVAAFRVPAYANVS